MFLVFICSVVAGFESDRGGMREDREDREAYRRGPGDCETDSHTHTHTYLF